MNRRNALRNPSGMHPFRKPGSGRNPKRNPYEPKGTIGGLEDRVEAARKAWIEEQIGTLRGKEVKGRIQVILEENGANRVWSGAEISLVVAEIISYLTTPQVKVSSS